MSEHERRERTEKPPETETSHKSRPCPICSAPYALTYRPFCSRRCADVDLSRWLSGRYAIAGGDADEDEDGDQARAAEAAQRIRPDDE